MIPRVYRYAFSDRVADLRLIFQMFVSTFQAKKPQPLVYVRTLLQTFLFNEMEFLGTMSIRQILDDDFSIITSPASPLLDRANDEIEAPQDPRFVIAERSEEHTSELQSRLHLVCRLLLEKKNKTHT